MSQLTRRDFLKIAVAAAGAAAHADGGVVQIDDEVGHHLIRPRLVELRLNCSIVPATTSIAPNSPAVFTQGASYADQDGLSARQGAPVAASIDRTTKASAAEFLPSMRDFLLHRDDVSSATEASRRFWR